MRSMLQHLLFVTDYSVTSIMNIMLIIILFPVASFYLQQFGVTPFLILEVNSVYCIMSSSYLNFKGDIIAVITIVVIQTIVHWLHSHHLLFPHLKFGVVFYTQNSRLLGLEPLSHRFVTDFRGQVLGFESFQAAVRVCVARLWWRGRTAGVASVRRPQELPLGWTGAVSAGSKTDLLRDTAEPANDADGASVLTYLRKRKKAAQQL